MAKPSFAPSGRRLRPGLLAAALAACLAAAAAAATLTGVLVSPLGGPLANATLLLRLSQAAVQPGNFAVAPATVSCYTSSQGQIVGLPDLTTAPTGTAIAGSGTLPAGVYFIRLAFYGPAATALPSPELQLSLAAAGRLAINPPAQSPAGASGYNVYIGTGSGFNVSQAAAYLFGRSPATSQWPQGRTWVLDEFTAHHLTAADFARAAWERLGAGHLVRAWYLSPDCWSQRGEGHSLVEQMSEASGIQYTPATVDRIAGAMLIYSRLDSGELVVGSNCRQLIEAIPSRIHNPDRPDDILKIAGDPLDDCIDALRYGLASHHEMPRSAAAQLARAFTPSPDPTIAAIQYTLAEQRWAAALSPNRYLPFRDRGRRR